MNAILEEKLKDLIDEAERQGAPAAFVVLNLLLGNYQQGTHHKFAQHCCRFAPLEMLEVSVPPPERLEDISEDPDSVGYIN
jgi:hypothetical protein